MIDIDVKIDPKLKRKLNPATIKSATSVTIRNTTLEAERRCKVEAPGPGNQLPGTKYKAIGRLRRTHSSQIKPNEGLVENNSGYAKYVVHGTSRMPARNYPQKIANRLASEHYMSRTFLTELRNRGLI